MIRLNILMQKNKKLYFFSESRYLKLDLEVPNLPMLEEAKKLKNRFTEHRNWDNLHKGWKSLSLYGIDEDMHESWKDYGYESAEAAARDYKWTSAADECPVTVNWLKTKFPCERFGRVRLMLVEAGGYIGFHSDTTYKILENINIPLNNPEKCLWVWKDHGNFYMEPGGVYAMNISYEHSVVNDSNEDRYHLIVARHDSTPEWRKLIDEAAKKEGIEGHYHLHDIAT